MLLRSVQWLCAQQPLMRALRPLVGGFNPLLEEHRLDPYATWRRLHETDPMFYSRGFGAYFATGYDDVAAMLKSSAFTADRRETAAFRMMNWFNRKEPDFQGFMVRNLLMLDGPDHRRLRGLVGKAFTPRRVQALRPHLEEVAEDLLDEAASRGHLELISEFAYPFPVIAIAELLGVPSEDRERFRRWTADLVQVLDPLQGTRGAQPMRQATRELYAYFAGMLAERRVEPRDDLMSAMLQAEEGGVQLEDGDLQALCTLLLVAGHETTANLIGNAVAALLLHPEQRRRLQEDPSLLPTAVDEFLRYDSPVQFTDRAVLEDCEFGGKVLRRGQIVGLVLAAANRDPKRFADPDVLDVGRDPNPHLALSHGTHFCLGAQLARMEAEIAVGALLRRFPDFKGPAGPPEWRRSMLLRGPVALSLDL
ncbi:cytochrome P450 [Myxococcota bacterium]|nr:cytochrome P450 [Myxococcota bacterium]